MVPSNFPDRHICIMGLGYVGLTLAIVMAEVGFEVTGVEARADVVDGLRRGKPHFFETGLEQRLRNLIAQNRLRIESSIPAHTRARVFIITVGTPLAEDGRVNLTSIEKVSRDVAAHVPDGALVVMRSTVKVGATRRIVQPVLATTGRRFDLAFCPERTIEGQALSELRILPQIVGGHTLDADIRAAQLFQFVTPTVVRVHDLETAEMIKLIDNTQRDVFFAFSNEVARMCDRVGISATEVIAAGKLGYPRTNLPVPGTVGGPCLSKDTHLLVEAMNELGLTPEISVAARRLNETQPVDSVTHIRATTAELAGFAKRPTIVLMGLAFKGRPATDDLRGTTAKPIMDALRRTYPDATLRGFDAMVAAQDIRAFGLEPVGSLPDAFDGAHIAVIANNHSVFGSMPIETLSERMGRPALIYDFWNHFDARELKLPHGVTYMGLGAHGLATPAVAPA